MRSKLDRIVLLNVLGSRFHWSWTRTKSAICTRSDSMIVMGSERRNGDGVLVGVHLSTIISRQARKVTRWSTCSYILEKGNSSLVLMYTVSPACCSLGMLLFNICGHRAKFRPVHADDHTGKSGEPPKFNAFHKLLDYDKAYHDFFITD